MMRNDIAWGRLILICTFKSRNYKLMMANSISYPMKLHVNTFSAARGDGVVGNADSTGIVTKSGWSRLGKPQTGEDVPQHE